MADDTEAILEAAGLAAVEAGVGVVEVVVVVAEVEVGMERGGDFDEELVAVLAEEVVVVGISMLYSASSEIESSS